MRVLYIPVKDLTPINKLLPSLIGLLKDFKSANITSTTQFSHRVNEVSDYLLDRGFKTNQCKPVLGCEALLPNADCTILISSGLFHAINIGLVTAKPVVIIDLLMGKVSMLDESLVKQYKKKQAIRVEKVLYADVIGILISKKSGQRKPVLAHKIKKTLESLGYKTILFVGDELNPNQLNDYPVDAWINTACPRLIEDNFEKPIVNWNEIKSYF
jgi:2-(3-amino-3-carboxypropyl)histidine synthase